MVMEAMHEDMEERNMGCVNHQYKNKAPGGICAFCLQEKLGKLVSSSFPVAVFPSSSSSSTSPFRSDFGGHSTGGRAATLQGHRLASDSSSHSQFLNYIDTTRGKDDTSYLGYHTTRRSRIRYILTHGRKKQKGEMMACSDSNSTIFKRSMPTTNPRRGVHFLAEDHTHRTKFGSFLKMPKHPTNKTTAIYSKYLNDSSATPRIMCSSSISSSRDKKKEEFVVADETEDGSLDEAAFDRKVSRSRSVGCGSMSFSGDFFEKISTGFGDCTLRRVESQREAEPKTPSVHKIVVNERVKCGGIFSGFMTPSSSPSSSTEDKSISVTHSSIVNLSHGRIRSWGWALASPMRAFGKQPSTGKRASVSITNATPNLAAIPSLLAV